MDKLNRLLCIHKHTTSYLFRFDEISIRNSFIHSFDFFFVDLKIESFLILTEFPYRYTLILFLFQLFRNRLCMWSEGRRTPHSAIKSFSFSLSLSLFLFFLIVFNWNSDMVFFLFRSSIFGMWLTDYRLTFKCAMNEVSIDIWNSFFLKP